MCIYFRPLFIYFLFPFPFKYSLLILTCIYTRYNLHSHVYFILITCWHYSHLKRCIIYELIYEKDNEKEVLYRVFHSKCSTISTLQPLQRLLKCVSKPKGIKQRHHRVMTHGLYWHVINFGSLYRSVTASKLFVHGWWSVLNETPCMHVYPGL